MSDLNSLGIGSPYLSLPGQNGTEYVVIQRALDRILAFVGCSIDDVVNDPIIKNQVIGYYKLHKFVNRRCEIIELESQWNPAGTRL
jgi:hypothetical protein